MIIEVPRENIETIMGKKEGENSATIKTKVVSARKLQQKRFAETKLTANAQMSAQHIEYYVSLDEKSEGFIKKAAKQLHLSARVVHRSIKLARTIADLEGDLDVSMQHIAEAMQYRSKSMFIDE
jgi:magnesium chelatase family protein